MEWSRYFHDWVGESKDGRGKMEKANNVTNALYGLLYPYLLVPFIMCHFSAKNFQSWDRVRRAGKPVLRTHGC